MGFNEKYDVRIGLDSTWAKGKWWALLNMMINFRFP
jgi:hypothetical protein